MNNMYSSSMDIKLFHDSCICLAYYLIAGIVNRPEIIS